jgi:uncharacterized phage-associated protein
MVTSKIASANIFDVADYILRAIGDGISAMKLQKLCYYSQAWTLVWDGKHLFEEDFERWDNGPVCPQLFERHRGMFCVDSNIIEKSLLSNELSDEERLNIDRVIEDYGKYDGGRLSELTHLESPWKDTPKDTIIKKEVIRAYYSKLPSGDD